MKSTLNIATAAMMRPLGEALFGNGREQGMAAGANMARSLAAADYDQSRAAGQQRRNYMQSDEGLTQLARAVGGDMSNYDLNGLDDIGRKKAADTIGQTLQALALTGDTNLPQFAKAGQDMAVRNAAVYENNPVKAAMLSAAFNNGKLWDNAGNGQTYNVATGGLQDSGLTRAIIGEKNAQAQYGLAGVGERNAQAGLYNAQTEGVRMDNQIMPIGNPSALSIDQVWSGLIGQESGGNQAAVSPKGAIGVAQVMPGTAPYAAKLAGLPFDERRYKTDAQYNAALGRAYLNKMHQQFGGDMKLALGAYNAGPGAMQNAIARDRAAGGNGTFESVARFLPRETQNYVPSILARLNGGGGVRRKYAEPQLANRATGSEKLAPLSGPLGDAFKVQQVGPDGKPMMDVNDRPIMGEDTASRQKFYRWINQNGINDMNAGLVKWEALGRPDAGGGGAPAFLDGSIVGAFLNTLNSLPQANQGQVPISPRPQSPAPVRQATVTSNGITTKEILEQAALSHTNPGTIVAHLRQKGIAVPANIIAELRRQEFAVN